MGKESSSSSNVIPESINRESGLFSHPCKFLENHTESVTQLALLSLENNPSLLIDKEILRKVTELITTSHDLGKATSYFQHYITADTDEEKKKLKCKKSTHALFGAVVAYFLTKEFLQSQSKYNGLFRFLPIVAFLACKKHHGDLQDVYNHEVAICEDISLLKEQLESIDKRKFSLLLQKLGSPFSIDWLYERFDMIEDAVSDMQCELEALLREETYLYYFLVHLIYSFLLDADKSEVAVSKEDMEEIAERRNEYDLNANLVSLYKENQNWEKKDIDMLREEAFREVLQNEINLDEKIYSINLPTGLGKTLTSLAFALKLREKIRRENSYTPRIIYSLPFLSVIDQNFSVFEDVLRENGIEPLSPILLKHHHLSEVNYNLKEGEEDFEVDASNILIEGWNSEIVVTTFIQLFHTLISNKNRSIRKFHRIAESIVILDEVQAIPHKFWLLMHDVISYMAEKFNTYFIFVTATEPLIFKREELRSLVNRNKYFRSLNRLKLKPFIEDVRTIEEFAGWAIPEVSESDKRFLFIFNTIGAAKEFYGFLKDNGLAQEEMTYLSTHVIPKERLGRIAEIRGGRKRIAVTTQLVEAGVDIDFDVVYRDFAPLDSINQSAGRCNRNGLSTGGEIRIVNLRDERRNYAGYIYDSTLLDKTTKVLRGKEVIEEGEFLNLIEEYYRLISDAKSDDESRKILKAFYRLNYDGDDGISSFKLIKEDYEKVDIFIELDEKAQELWERYLEIRTTKNLFERRKEFQKIKSLFYNYVVAVPKRKDLNLPAIIEGFPYVSNTQIEDYYDIETGYKTKGGVLIW